MLDRSTAATRNAVVTIVLRGRPKSEAGEDQSEPCDQHDDQRRRDRAAGRVQAHPTQAHDLTKELARIVPPGQNLVVRGPDRPQAGAGGVEHRLGLQVGLQNVRLLDRALNVVDQMTMGLLGAGPNPRTDRSNRMSSVASA